MPKRSHFYGTIFEPAFKKLKDIESVRTIYNKQSSQIAKCPIADCIWTGRKIADFYYHVRTNHPTEYNASTTEENEHTAPIDDSGQLEHDQVGYTNDVASELLEAVDFDDPFEVTTPSQQSGINSTFLQNIHHDFPIELRKRMYSKMDKIVELRWREVLPESTFSRVTEELLLEFLRGLESKLTKQEADMYERLRRFASSLHLQQQYLKSLGHLIEPETITITEELTIQYIAIDKVARQALNSSLISQILREQDLNYTCDFSTYSSVMTCNHERWNRIKGKLRIELYLDDFSIVNPIGAHKHDHKYLAIYCTFANVPASERAKRNDIYLLLIANHKAITNKEMFQVLDRLSNDLHELCTNGIEIQSKNSNQVIKIPCVLAHLVADNLEHYQLVGASLNFHKYYNCRFCGANFNEIQLPNLTKQLFGSTSDIDEYWSLVHRSNGIDLPNNRFSLKRTFQFASKELDIHPWNCMPPDLTHDVCEGVMPKMISFLLKELGQLYGKSKASIVAAVCSYQFYDRKFCITSVKGGFKIGGDAVQRTELFIRLHQIMLDLFVPNQKCPIQVTSTKHFGLYIALKQIFSISFNYEITRAEVLSLKVYTTRAIRIIKEIDANYAIFPKLHQTLHYGHQIQLFGPLAYFTTLKYERKHSYFKKWARVMKNHINPALSLAVRHQCYFMLCFREKDYQNYKFDFTTSKLDCSTKLLNCLPPVAVCTYACERPFALKKGVIRRIKNSNLWIEAKKFLTAEVDGVKQMYINGVVYKKSVVQESSLTILVKKSDSSFIEIESVHFVNDFIDIINNHFVLICGLF